jgi:uncharacterized cupin superfamily protein
VTAEPVIPVVRLSELELEDFELGTRYASKDRHFTTGMGLTRLGATYTEVPPGKTACPYHVHHAKDEMFVVLAGKGEYRFGSVVHQVQAGDVLAAPVGGAEYAHQLVNTGNEPLKYIAISSAAQIEVCEYPDSGKFQVIHRPGSEEAKFRFVGRQETTLDYWDGESV